MPGFAVTVTVCGVVPDVVFNVSQAGRLAEILKSRGFELLPTEIVCGGGAAPPVT